MSKHRKTLKEKKLADLRHEQTLPMNYQFVPRSYTPSINGPKQTISISIYSHSYLKQDLLKTIFLTISLITIQLMTFFILKTHILKLPTVNF